MAEDKVHNKRVLRLQNKMLESQNSEDFNKAADKFDKVFIRRHNKYNDNQITNITHKKTDSEGNVIFSENDKKTISAISDPVYIKKDTQENPPATSSKNLSLSNYKEPELMPMREKVVLSRKDRKAKELLTRDSKRYGINLDIGDNPDFNYGKTINPVVPKDRPNNLTESARNLQSDDPAIIGKAFLDIKGKAPQQKVPELDSKQEMEDAKRQRKARWADALTGFGQVMQGKTVNTDDWETSKLQRKRDERFQEYKDIVSNNKKVKDVWDAKNRDELIDFLDKQSKVRDLNEREAAKLAEARFVRDRDYALKQADLAAKIKSGYYNKRTSTGKAEEMKFNLPFESENIINEMNNITGGASEAKTKRNQQRLAEMLFDTETGKPKAGSEETYNTLIELSDKSAKLRTQIEKKEKAVKTAISNDDAVNAPKYQAELDELNSQLEEYQNNIKSILNGKAPAASTEKQKVNKDGFKAYYGKDYKPDAENKQQSTPAPETQKKLDDFFN
jgi:hypothetical protein